VIDLGFLLCANRFYMFSSRSCSTEMLFLRDRSRTMCSSHWENEYSGKKISWVLSKTGHFKAQEVNAATVICCSCINLNLMKTLDAYFAWERGLPSKWSNFWCANFKLSWTCVKTGPWPGTTMAGASPSIRDKVWRTNLKPSFSQSSGKTTPKPFCQNASPLIRIFSLGENKTRASMSCPGAAWICQTRSLMHTSVLGNIGFVATKGGHVCPMPALMWSRRSHIKTSCHWPDGMWMSTSGKHACKWAFPPQWSECKCVLMMAWRGVLPNEKWSNSCSCWAWVQWPVSTSVAWDPRSTRELEDNHPLS